MKTVDAVIIGGGISGLTAAYALRQTGKSVLLIEKNSEVGGCIRTRMANGFTLELGANTLVKTPTTVRILSELGLLEDAIEPTFYPFQQYVWSTKHNAPRAMPKGPIAFLKTDLFSLADKIRIVFGIFEKTAVTNRESVAEAFSKLIGAGPVAVAIAPALRGIFGGDVDKLALTAVFPRIADALNSGKSLFTYMKQIAKGRKVFHLRGGNQRIALGLAAQMKETLLLNTEVTAITKASDSFSISASGQQITAKEIFLANNEASLRTMLSLIDPRTPTLPSLRYAPITVVHCAIPKSNHLLPNAFGILFPKDSPARILGVLFNSQLFPDMAPSDQHLITVCIGGINGYDCDSATTSELEHIVSEDLKNLLSITGGTFLNTYQWKNAIPQFESSFFDLQSAFTDFETAHPGVYIIGVECGSIGVPDRMERVLSKIAPTR